MTRTMKVKAEKKTDAPPFDEIEITLPFYRKHDLSEEREYCIYTRHDENHTETEITRKERRDGAFDWELETSLNVAMSHVLSDYSLGRGEHSCTEEEFSEVLAEFKAQVVSL